MRPTTRLRALQTSATQRIRRLRRDLQVQLFGPSTSQRQTEAQIAIIVIEVLNSWTNFVRAYYLSCLLRPHRSRGGRIEALPTIRGFDEGIGIAVKCFRPHTRPKMDGSWDRRAEPTWHDPRTLIELARRLRFSHCAQIEAAFSGMHSRTFRDLPVFRNYFAHRNLITLKAALDLAPSYGIAGLSRPAEIMCARGLHRHQTLAMDWIDDIEMVVEYLCY